MAKLTHLDEKGAARMVDVGSKAVTARTAVAEGIIRMNAAALEALTQGTHPKGDAIATARIAGIMAAKKTGELIPLCHTLALDSVTVAFTTESGGIRVRSEASLTGKTGVEMEAMTATSVALLTLYDMGKSLDKGMRIEAIRLLEKTGGKSGTWRVED
ncbi:MAG: cyclic pyranopterin monophosphate synthase MoaC [Erythrobacter sp.]|nr:cyclic pyranopterin monophosphate synthase MoaC [Erythrobacter sp.]